MWAVGWLLSWVSAAAAAQAKYGRLHAGHPQASEEAPPTLEDIRVRVAGAKQLTVRDVWGLMLTTVPGGSATR